MIDELLRRLVEAPVVPIDADQLRALCDEIGDREEIDASIGGMIRIFRGTFGVLIQEETEKKQFIVRRFESDEAADAFVRDRLDKYERMWDGCGCRIDYGI
jgi:hypothetical protein